MNYDLGDEISYKGEICIVLGMGRKADSIGIVKDYILLEGVDKHDVFEIFVDELLVREETPNKLKPLDIEIKPANDFKPKVSKPANKLAAKNDKVVKDSKPAVKNDTVKVSKTKIAKPTKSGGSDYQGLYGKVSAIKKPAKSTTTIKDKKTTSAKIKKPVVKPGADYQGLYGKPTKLVAKKTVSSSVKKTPVAKKTISKIAGSDYQGLYGKITPVKPVKSVSKPATKSRKPTPATVVETIIVSSTAAITPVDVLAIRKRNSSTADDYSGLYGREINNEVRESVFFNTIFENDVIRGKSSSEIVKVDDFFPSVELLVSRKVKTAFPKRIVKRRVKANDEVIVAQAIEELPLIFETEEVVEIEIFDLTPGYERPFTTPKVIIAKVFPYNEKQRIHVDLAIRHYPFYLKAPSPYSKQIPRTGELKIGVVNYVPDPNEVRIDWSNIASKQEVKTKSKDN